MFVCCPHCHESVEVHTGLSMSQLTCPQCGSAFNLADNESAISTAGPTGMIGRFHLIEQSGVGAFGVVWKAHDSELDRFVAIKVPRPERLNLRAADQFASEARAAAQLKHPHIVTVHEVGQENDQIYIVTDFVEGLNAAEWLFQNRPSVRTAVSLCAKIADGLQHAHEHHIIHRDLKPSNVMIDAGGDPHVMDFGLAKQDAQDVTMTMDGEVLGTAAYIPPEQALGHSHEADCRSDVYSLGIMLFEFLTGERPFRGTTHMLIMHAIHTPPPALRDFVQNIPRDLEMICLKAISKEPAHRYQSAGEFADDLRRFLNQEPVYARPVGIFSKLILWTRQVRRIHDAGTFMMVLGGGFAVMEVVGILTLAARKFLEVERFWVFPYDPLRAYEVFGWFSLFVILGLFMFFIGRKTTQLYRSAIWSGLLISGGLAAFCFCVWGGVIEFTLGGMMQNEEARALFYLPNSVLCTALFCLYLTAVVAMFSNRETIRFQQG